jgi:hypothetical protein
LGAGVDWVMTSAATSSGMSVVVSKQTFIRKRIVLTRGSI